MNESDKLPPTGLDTNQPINPIPEIPTDLPESGNIVAPDTILYNPDGTPKETLLTTPTGLENNIQKGASVDNADVLRVAQMERARKEQGNK